MNISKAELRRFYRHVRELYPNYEVTSKRAKALDLKKVFKFVTTSLEVGGTMKAVVEMIDYIQAYAFGSCEVERIGRLMNLTKTSLRTDLGDDRFFALCFIKHTMPSLDAIDWAPLLEMWYADGHHNANSLARGDDPSIVLKRLAKEAKLRDHTPIGTKRVR